MKIHFIRTCFLMIIFCTPFFLTAQTSINGLITQSFNANAEGKPDAGSKIYLLRYEGDATALYETISNFLTAKSLKSQNGNVNRMLTIYKDSAAVVKSQRKFADVYLRHQNLIAKIKADEADRNAQLVKLGADNNASFDKLDERTSKALSQVKLKAFETKTLADAAGNYTLNTSAGNFMLLIISNNRNGLTSTEVSGKIYAQLVEIKEGEKLTVNYKFYPD